MDKRHFVGGALRSRRGPRRPLRRDARLRQGGADRAAPRSSGSAASPISQQRPDGAWDVVTEKGTIHAEHVVNAGGLWAREVGRMVGLELPVLAMEHHYLITEDMPELVGHEGAAALHRLRGRDLYAPGARRHAARHLRAATASRGREASTPWDFGQNLLPNDLDRIAPEPRGRLRAFPGLATGRHQEDRQRPLHLRAGRQPAGRPGQGPARISGSPAA